jgi:hypothetical protein
LDRERSEREESDGRLQAAEHAVKEKQASSEAQRQQIEDLQLKLAEAKKELETQADEMAKLKTTRSGCR